MPIRCGSTVATKAYCGTNEIVRGYCGENLFFGSAPVAITAPLSFSSLSKTGSSISARQGAMVAGTKTTGIIFGGAHSSSYRNDFYRYVRSGANVALTALTRSGASISVRRYGGIVGNVGAGIIVGGHNPTALNDAYRYAVAGSTVTLTAMTVAGTFPAQSVFSMVGDTSSGLIYGGLQTFPPNLNDFYRYVTSGDTITFTVLTKAGAAITNRYGVSMVGDATSGLFFGGRTGNGDRSDFYRYSIAGSTITLTLLTKSGNSPPSMYGASIVGDKTSGIIFYGQAGSTQQSGVFRYVATDTAVNIRSVTKSGSSPNARSFMTAKGDTTSGILFSGRAGSTTYSDFYSYSTS